MSMVLQVEVTMDLASSLDCTEHTVPFPLCTAHMLWFASPKQQATENKAFLASKTVTEPTTHNVFSTLVLFTSCLQLTCYHILQPQLK